MSYGNLGDGLAVFLLFTIFVALPLALWKLIDIVLWLFTNVQIGLR